MKNLQRSRRNVLVLSTLALAIFGAAASAKKETFFELNILLPGADEAGVAFVSIDPPSGIGDAKIVFNTKNGKFRITVKGEAANLGTKSAKFTNDPLVVTVLLEGVGGEGYQRVKYSVSKAKKGTFFGKAKGNIKGQLGAS